MLFIKLLVCYIIIMGGIMSNNIENSLNRAKRIIKSRYTGIFNKNKDPEKCDYYLKVINKIRSLLELNPSLIETAESFLLRFLEIIKSSMSEDEIFVQINSLENEINICFESVTFNSLGSRVNSMLGQADLMNAAFNQDMVRVEEAIAQANDPNYGVKKK